MFVLTVAMNCLSTAEQTYETCAPDDARLFPANTDPPNTRAEQASVAAERRFIATDSIIVVAEAVRPSLDRGFTGPVHGYFTHSEGHAIHPRAGEGSGTAVDRAGGRCLQCLRVRGECRLRAPV